MLTVSLFRFAMAKYSLFSYFKYIRKSLKFCCSKKNHIS